MENMELTEQRRIPEGCTLKDYRRSYASPELYKTLNSWCIAGYVLAGFSAVVNVLANLLGLVDSVFMLAMVYMVHKKHMKGGVIGIVCNVALGNILSLLGGGGFIGWGWLIVAVGMISVFNKIDGEYKELTANSPNL